MRSLIWIFTGCFSFVSLCGKQRLSVFGQTGLTKQCRPWSGPAEHGVWSASTMFPLIQQILDALIGCKMDLFITKTYLYNFDPLKPHFYIVKLGFIEVYVIFLLSAQNIECGYSLEPPHRGDSNEYSQSMFWAEIRKKSEFLSKNFHFLIIKFLVYLNRLVFVMLNVRIGMVRS